VPFGSLLDEWPQLTEKPATEDHFRKSLHQRDGNCKWTAAEEWSDQQQLRNVAAVGDCAGQHPAYSVRMHAEKEQAAGDCHRQLLEQRSTGEFCSQPFQKASAEFHGSGQQQLLQKVTAPGGSEQVDQTPAACEEVYMQQQPSAAGVRTLIQGQQAQATEFSSVEQKQQTMPRQCSSLKVKEMSAVGSLFHQQPEGFCQLVEQNFSIR
jgi:hypothetical protein